MKLALGTAQFGLRYGVANTAGQVKLPEIKAILSASIDAGIDTLDTAIAYGDSEACLGEAGISSSWRVITKLPPLPASARNLPRWVNEQVSGSLSRLRVSKLDAVLLHRPSDLLGPHGDAYRKTLATLKARGTIEAVGVSIYDPAELDAIWPVYRPDIVQTPLNVLDRRLLKSSWLERLARHGVRIHTRSAFLQGLLLMNANQRPAWFSPWTELLERWVQWYTLQNVTPLQAALSFSVNQPAIERVVVGVDSVRQLREILSASSSILPMPPEDLCSEDLNLLEPSRWKYL